MRIINKLNKVTYGVIVGKRRNLTHMPGHVNALENRDEVSQQKRLKKSRWSVTWRRPN